VHLLRLKQEGKLGSKQIINLCAELFPCDGLWFVFFVNVCKSEYVVVFLLDVRFVSSFNCVCVLLCFVRGRIPVYKIFS
jgi:hypothetical protein